MTLISYNDYLYTGVSNLLVGVASEEYGVDNVTVQLEYGEEPNLTYSLTVLDLNATTSTNITGFQPPNVTLTLSYNTEYRVSFMASHCGQAVFTFHYGKITIVFIIMELYTP